MKPHFRIFVANQKTWLYERSSLMIYIPVVFDDDLHETRFIWHGILIPQLFAYIIGKSKCTPFLFCILASVCLERNYTCVIGKTWFYITRYFECYGKEVTRKYFFADNGPELLNVSIRRIRLNSRISLRPWSFRIDNFWHYQQKNL